MEYSQIIEELWHLSQDGRRDPTGPFLVIGERVEGDVHFLSKCGYSVYAFSKLSNGLDKLYDNKNSNLTLLDECPITVEKGCVTGFLGVFDKEVLCCLDEGDRVSYIKACKERLAKGGLLWSLVPVDDPPMETSFGIEALMEALGQDFSLLAAETRTSEDNAFLLSIWRLL